MKKLLFRYRHFLKFASVAAGYNLLAYSIYALLVYLNCNYLVASTISFISGVIASYFMNKSLVFAVNDHNYALMVRYVLFYSALLGINLLLLHIMVSVARLDPYLAQIVVTAAAALISYNTMRVFVFRKK